MRAVTHMRACSLDTACGRMRRGGWVTCACSHACRAMDIVSPADFRSVTWVRDNFDPITLFFKLIGGRPSTSTHDLNHLRMRA